jgi:hypothetical protein
VCKKHQMAKRFADRAYGVRRSNEQLSIILSQLNEVGQIRGENAALASPAALNCFRASGADSTGRGSRTTPRLPVAASGDRDGRMAHPEEAVAPRFSVYIRDPRAPANAGLSCSSPSRLPVISSDSGPPQLREKPAPTRK